jgi:uncharacterized protein YlzI (FlbEa/FlbD family)
MNHEPLIINGIKYIPETTEAPKRQGYIIKSGYELGLLLGTKTIIENPDIKFVQLLDGDIVISKEEFDAVISKVNFNNYFQYYPEVVCNEIRKELFK